MESDGQTGEKKVSAALDSPELQTILTQIDEALAQKPAADIPEPPQANISAAPEPVSSMEKLISLSNWLRMSSAPMRPSIIGGLRGFLWRILNIAPRVFIPTQIGFNNNLREFLGELMTELRARNIAISLLEQKNRQLYEINDQREAQIHRLNLAVDQLQARILTLSGVEDQLSTFKDQLSTFKLWMKAQDERHTGTEKWIQLLGTEVRGLALEARSVKESEVSESKSARIIHPDDFAQKIQNMQGMLKVNLGSGNKMLEGYINVDFRELEGIDVVSEIDDLPFLPETVDEIASAHLVEHFREYVLTSRLLPYWRSLLKKGGRLRITCPNWQAMLDRLNSGEMSLAQFKLLTFGGQDYEGNDHFSMYTPESLGVILENAGFVDIQTIVEDRDNGGCPEMELVAVKPD